MKKTYINPDMEVVTIMTTGMLAASSLTLDSSVNVDDVDVLLAPEMPDMGGALSSDALDGFFE